MWGLGASGSVAGRPSGVRLDLASPGKAPSLNLDRAKAALHLWKVVAMWFAILFAKVDILRMDIPHLGNARALCNF